MAETDLIVKDEDLAREKWVSVAILVLLPLPCVGFAVAQARSGHPTSSWVFLGFSIVLEVLVAVDRALIMRGLAGLAVSAREGILTLHWVGESREFRREDVVETVVHRGFLTGRGLGLWIRTPSETLRLPWFEGAGELQRILFKEKGAPDDRRAFPVFTILGLIVLILLAAGAEALKLPRFWLGPVLAFFLAGLFAAYPLYPVLGPRYRRWDFLLSASLILVGVSLGVSAAVMAFTMDWTAPGDLPRSPGDARSLAIFRLGRSANPEALRTLLDLSLGPDAGDRRDAAFALGAQGSPAAFDTLKKAAKDDAAGVRLAAVYALGSFQGDGAKMVLLHSLAEEVDLSIAKEANRSLERITGLAFEVGTASKFLREDDRELAIAFWVSALGG
ncbi:MAG: HEAT repeat domain-containing protein [Planctomycetota bacterium]